MTYAIRTDRSEEFKTNFEKWVNHGRNALEDNCKHKDKDNGNETNMRYAGYCDKCGVSEDSAQPMMNFIYPLYQKPSDKQILNVVNKTNLTVMENTEEDTFYLTLCGGGMDLSQDIGLAYILCGEWIPFDLALETCTQPALSVSMANYRKVMAACKKTLRKDINNAKFRIKQINEQLHKKKAV